MRILLIQAIDVNRVNPEIAPPIGLMYLGAYARERGHEVKLIDLRFCDGDLGREISSFAPDVVGISGFTINAKLIQATAKTARDAAPKALQIVGGPHATAYADAVLDESGVDVAVIGEGEKTLGELLDAHSAGRDFGDIHGIVYRYKGAPRRTPARDVIMDVDSLPMPAWDLIDIDKYSYDKRFVHLREREKFMAVFSSRGCPYRCIYCHQIMGKCFRARSPESVMKEVAYLHDKLGIREIEFWDDSFNLDKDRAMRILQGIIDRRLDLKLSFRNGVRGDRLDRELIRKMKEAGTHHIGFGFEAGTDRIQKLIKKNLDISKVLEAVNEAVELKIFTRGFFMLGFPSERREEIEATIDIALRSKLHLASFFIVIAFKGSEIYDLAKSMGKKMDFDYDEYDYNITANSLSDVPNGELIKLQRMAYIKFFSSPDRLWRIARDLPNAKQIPHYAIQFAKRIRLF